MEFEEKIEKNTNYFKVGCFIVGFILAAILGISIGSSLVDTLVSLFNRL